MPIRYPPGPPVSQFKEGEEERTFDISQDEREYLVFLQDERLRLGKMHRGPFGGVHGLFAVTILAIVLGWAIALLIG